MPIGTQCLSLKTKVVRVVKYLSDVVAPLTQFGGCSGRNPAHGQLGVNSIDAFVWVKPGGRIGFTLLAQLPPGTMASKSVVQFERAAVTRSWHQD